MRKVTRRNWNGKRLAAYMEKRYEIITHYPCLVPGLAACQSVAPASSTGASMLAGRQLLSILGIATALLMPGSGIYVS
ncbi:MAG: hypothetical protein J7463_16575 [Roseiflexus sp.]|nr:hypothetical protein [Roseiflexus sp.]MBO9334443.1 hypothetical protein [Roseiflexus sp.]MBO9365772.1 hypothetical protein [Roseiflexus sp.]MBO9382438.1 hypothetical protein [Roseiflexus sp.]MBO9388834.1 hypothetical protein [Roseiflexus sp.]